MVKYRREWIKNIWQDAAAFVGKLKVINIAFIMVSTRLTPREQRHILQFCCKVYHASVPFKGTEFQASSIGMRKFGIVVTGRGHSKS